MSLPNINEERSVDEQSLSKHAIKEQEKERRSEEQRLKDAAEIKKQKTKNIIILSVVLLIIAGGIYYFSDKFKPKQAYIPVQVHWHAPVELLVCGQARNDLKILGVNEHAGASALHTHGDGVIHLEPAGPVFNKEEINLGAFFDSVGLKFSETQLLDKKNRDKCGDKEGKVKMFVNDKENNEFRLFNFKDGDRIKIVFE